MTLSKGKARLIARLRDRRGRSREGLLLAEGLRVAEEAVASGLRIRFAVFSPRLRESERGRAVADALKARGVTGHLIDEGALRRLADTESPQGLLLVCEVPPHSLDDLEASGEGGYLVVDGVQDPGNMGALARASRAFGLNGVIVLPGSVDPWNPKTVRASAGASFGMPVVRCDWEACRAWLARSDTLLMAADPAGVDVAGTHVPPRWALAIGSEGHGLGREVRQAAARTVAVPMAGGTESLNAALAGAILLYALSRAGAPGGRGPSATGAVLQPRDPPADTSGEAGTPRWRTDRFTSGGLE